LKFHNISVCIKILILLFILEGNSSAQDPADSSLVNHKLLKGVILTESIASVSSFAGLYFAWYADYPQSSFHFINDNNEWLQMDKMGHATVAYNIGKAGYELLRWPNVDKRKSVWYGGTLGLAYLTVIEIMDGFSEEWGASLGDMSANVLGSGLFIGQQLAWDEQRISLKRSYHESRYSQYRPGQLGRNFPERMLKDYNGQTFWLSVNVHSFLPDKSRFPKWLNLALGYGADGMIGGRMNPSVADGTAIPSFNRERKYFLSLDLDMSRIETRSKTLGKIFKIASIFKFPFPAVEYSAGHRWILHGIYY
jgi:hypothetical protein